MSLTIKLQDHRTQTLFNLERWAEVVADFSLTKIEGRVETDRHGYVLIGPLLPGAHGFYEAEIGYLLSKLMTEGRVCLVSPISTADGVRATDVAWASFQSLNNLGAHTCFPTSPEICVEIISPGNPKQEIKEKMALYFDAGAQEVWLCSPRGEMRFFAKPDQEMQGSILCPKFPRVVQLPA